MRITQPDWDDIIIPHVVCSDLLPDLLIRLPLKSLIRFGLVCKRWQSIITSHPIILRHLLICNQNTTPAGLLILSVNSLKIDFVPFFSTPVIPTLTVVGFDAAHYYSLQSCNGLLLCSKYFDDSARYPTTKKSLRLPEPGDKGGDWTDIIGMCLAFDPADSPCYKVVALIWKDNFMFQIYIYSSNTGMWRESGHSFYQPQMFRLQGVYWNGAVHWISSNYSISPYYFNVENEMLRTMPSVPMTKSIEGGDRGNSFYVGETCGHLYYVESGFEELDIYEMKRDYSEWFLKHTVNLLEMTMGEYYYRKVVVLSVVCGEDDNVPFLIVRVPGKIIRYNLVSNTCEKLHDIEDEKGQIRASHYIESLCPV